ncbi:mitochondrial pyruvate carrier 2 [Helicoverpa armigera]|uniref:mitochondrial pyruvate carrier 2 n=1 Tax=Helicoverpa armigera TaxID=29058 RepID=UPI000B39679D|nr:mitochondrial pyruvate carrier 2 [Helicoverpa armigera]XP_047034622.1 mitochondrial pyruvate carrier 2-like [Helicoverpa zea]
MSSKLYKAIITFAEKFVPNALRPLWEHPAGPKTIFFWAPFGKWGLVIAGFGDINRPVEKLSVRQCGSLALTGTLWARWSLIIIPKNYSLFFANCFVAVTGFYQLSRIYLYERRLEEEKKLKEKEKK